MTVLCCGDREWDNVGLVRETLKPLGAGTVVIHGACRGADVICGQVAEFLGYAVKAYPADWERHGRAAGPVRNKAMLAMHPEIALVLAFHDHLERSKGTADMINRALQTGIPCRVVSTLPGTWFVPPLQLKLL